MEWSCYDQFQEAFADELSDELLRQDMEELF